jgi:hypothetical protein
VRECLGPEVAYLILYAFILFVVARNVILVYLLLYLNQVCMCGQWLIVKIVSSVNTTHGVL